MDQHGSTVNDPRISWPGPQDRQKKNSSNSSSSRQKFKAILSPNQKTNQKMAYRKRGQHIYTWHGHWLDRAFDDHRKTKTKTKTKTKARQGN